MIFWNEKGQFEKAFPSAKSARKKTTKKYASVVPYSNGKKIKYLMYGSGKKEYFCYFLGKNRMVVILALYGEVGWDNDKSYLLDIDVKKQRLISVEKCDGWLVGADSRYRYGLR